MPTSDNPTAASETGADDYPMATMRSFELFAALCTKPKRLALLREYGRTHRAFIPVSLGALFLLLAAQWIALSSPQYTAIMVISPNQSRSPAGALGGLLRSANSMGLMANLDADTQFERFKYLLRSPRTAEVIEKKYHVMPKIFANQWNKKNKAWSAPISPVLWVKTAIYAPLGQPVWRAPDAQAFGGYIDSHLRLDTMAGEAITTVSYTSSDPQFSAFMLNVIVREADNAIRQDRITKLDSQISYGEGQLQKLTLQDTRTALLETLADAYRQRVLAGGRGLYVGDILQDVTVPANPSWPRPGMMLAICLAGWCFSMLLIYGGKAALRLVASL